MGNIIMTHLVNMKLQQCSMSDGQAPNEDQAHNKWVYEFLNMKIIDPWKFSVGRYTALDGVVC